MEREGYRLGHSLIDYFLSFLVCVSFILEAGCKCGGLMRAQGNDKGPVVYDAKLRVLSLLLQWELVKARILSDKPPL